MRCEELISIRQSRVRPEKVVVSPQDSVTMMELDWACDCSAINTCAIVTGKEQNEQEFNSLCMK